MHVDHHCGGEKVKMQLMGSTYVFCQELVNDGEGEKVSLSR